jgi:TRAP-type C4-dicarboxylate transport system permease small subunit
MRNSLSTYALNLVLSFIAVFFILFGINLLSMAYRIPDPFSFVVTFFASNLIILISAALLLGFILRIVENLKRERQEKGLNGTDQELHHATAKKGEVLGQEDAGDTNDQGVQYRIPLQ